MITPMLSLEDVRPEARKAAEAWVLKADPQYKKRFYRFFADGPEGASPARASAGSAGGAMPSLTTFEEAEKELELRNWATMYQTTNNSLGPALLGVQARAKGDAGRVIQPLVKDVIKSKSTSKIDQLVANLSKEELTEFIKLLRSLSIAYEQDRTAYSSEYFVSYEPKTLKNEPAPEVDYRASSLTGPVTYAPPKMGKRLAPVKEPRQPTPQMAKMAPKPKGGGPELLAWPGGNVGGLTSTYRAFHTKPAEVYPDVIAERHDVSMACGRTVPDNLVGDKHRQNIVVLPWDMESRHRLKHKRPQAAPSWHLLYKDGVVYTDKPGKHDKGELSIYGKDFVQSETEVKPAKPTLDPFGSSITVGMSDYPYHTTTYQATLGRSATMEYDRRLV